MNWAASRWLMHYLGTMMVEDPEKPRGGRAHRIGLCTEDAQAMQLGHFGRWEGWLAMEMVHADCTAL